MADNLNIRDNDNTLLKQAMDYGLILGLFWAIKYLVFVAAGWWVHFIYLYYLLNVGTFLLVYIFYFKYKQSDGETPRPKTECFMFVVALCFFASFFESAMMYAHFQFIDPSYFSTKIEPVQRGIIEAFPYSEEVKGELLSYSSNRILYIISNFIGNLFLGVILGGLMTFAVGNKKN